MTDMDLARILRRLSVETGSLVCLGCEHEHACSIHGCAIMRTAADRIEQLTAEPTNAPLTLEELREIGTGEWLWIECLERFKSDKAVSAYYRKHKDYTQGDSFCCGYPGVSFGFEHSDYGISWLAYRRKPDGGGE